MQGIFVGNKIEAKLNNTLIVLIPKKDKPKDFSQFRPISLCLVMYKLVKKVVTNRFKLVFSNFISQEQVHFIVGHNISNNVIIAQEVIHFMCSKRIDRNWMVIKLGLEKAYDRVSWEFIEAFFLAARTLEFLRSVIMDAISSSMQILWNGAPTQKFNHVRGIRQECPLSPYLFVPCMEWLDHLIHTKIDAGKWNPIRLSRSCSMLSHLFFAVDLVIFCKAEVKQAVLLKEILKHFCDFSGHKVSARKSNIDFFQRS